MKEDALEKFQNPITRTKLDKNRKVNPVRNYYKKSIKIDSTGMIKTQHTICQVMVGGAICGKKMVMPQACLKKLVLQKPQQTSTAWQ